MKARFNKARDMAKKKKASLSMGAPTLGGSSSFPRAESVEEKRRKEAVSGLSRAGHGSTGGGQFPRAHQVDDQRRQQSLNQLAGGRSSSSGGGNFPRANDVDEQRRQQSLNQLAGARLQRGGGGGNFPRADDVRREQALNQLSGAGSRGKEKKPEKVQTGFHSLEGMMAEHEASGGGSSESLGNKGKDLFTKSISIEPNFGSEASSEQGDLLDWDDLNTPKGGPPGGGFKDISLDDNGGEFQEIDLLGGF